MVRGGWGGNRLMWCVLEIQTALRTLCLGAVSQRLQIARLIFVLYTHTHMHTHMHTHTHTHTSTHAHKPQICGSAERRMQWMRIGGWGVGKKEDSYDNLTELYTFIGAVVSLTLFQMPHQPDLLLI